ncbi:MAG: hypothetical protein V3T30_01085, partial [Thermodesulfobacteriota bacterium]
MSLLQLIPTDTEPYRSMVDILRQVVLERVKEWCRSGSDGGVVAIKCHFGEAGGTGYLKPIYLRAVADAVREAGMAPFATDTVVLYQGGRRTAPGYL